MAKAPASLSSGRRATIWLTAGALIIAGGYEGSRFLADRWRGADFLQSPQPIPVQAAQVTTRDVPIYLTGLGLVQALNTVTVRTRVDGEIQKIVFDEGQMVQSGDLLLQIDPRPFQAALDQANAKKLQDEATLVSAKSDLARTRQLLTQEFAPRQLFDQQQATLNALEAQIMADQAAIDNAQTQLSYTSIRSPLTGRTGFRLVDQGNIVHTTDAGGIAEITQIEPVAVIFTAPEDQLQTINKSQAAAPLQVVVSSPNGKEPLAEGRLTLVNNQVDTASGTIRLKAQFDNRDHNLWPGLSVATQLLVRMIRGANTVPPSAIQRGPQGLYAYVVKPDLTVEMRPVEVGPITDQVAVIEGGLNVGETVVTSGHYRLKPGSAVAVSSLHSPAVIAKQGS